MLDIKFRGKRVDNNEWVYGGYYKGVMSETNNPFSLDNARIKRIIIQEGTYYHVHPDSIALHSGYKDKNGIEIYSDSIMESTQQTFTDFGETPTGEFFKSTIEISYKNGYWIKTELANERWTEDRSNKGKQDKIDWEILLKYYTVIKEED